MYGTYDLVTLTILTAVTAVCAAQDTLFHDDFEAYERSSALITANQRRNYSAPEIASMIPGWSTVDDFSPQPCSCQDPRDDKAELYGTCNGYLVEPHSGCTHLEMHYMESAGSAGMATWGGSPYLTRAFAEPLRTGELYEFSVWIHLLPDEKVPPQRLRAMAERIGVQFFHEPARPHPSGNLFPGAQLQIATVRFGEWYRLQWTFRPECDLGYMAIGVFRNSLGPPTRSKFGLTYYLDDITLRRLPATAAGLSQATGVCRFVNEALAVALPPGVGEASVYFASGSAEFDSAARRTLDGYAGLARQVPGLTFTLTGHADTVAADNQALSEARVASVLDYLEAAHRIPRFRFATRGFGVARGRGGALAADRRVELRAEQGVDPSLIPYRHALELSWSGDVAAGLRALRMWEAFVPEAKRALVDFDPRAAALRAHPGYAAFAKTRHNSYRDFPRPPLARALDSLFFEDQRFRTLGLRIENLGAWFPELDSAATEWSVSFPVDSATWAHQDSMVLAEALRLLGAHGWPLVSEVGEVGARAVPLALIHSNNPDLIEQWLPTFGDVCRRGEGDWGDFALMTDRALVERGRPQCYGTQGRMVNGEWVAYLSEDPGGLALRRARLGLGLD